MSVFHPEHVGVAPRSALHYRPRNVEQESNPALRVKRKSLRQVADHTTTAPVISSDSKLENRRKEHTLPQRRIHPLFYIGLGLVSTLVAWVGIMQLITWGNGVLDLLHYGNPRTYQVDALVGQGDTPQHPSHFIAMNLHSYVVILEFPASDPAKAREFTISNLLGPHADQVVVTLRFLDVNHNGRPDMIISAGEAQAFLVNESGTFRPPTLDEQRQILQALQTV